MSLGWRKSRVLVAPGACIAIALTRYFFGAARITGKTKFGPTLEVGFRGALRFSVRENLRDTPTPWLGVGSLSTPKYAADTRAWTVRLERIGVTKR